MEFDLDDEHWVRIKQDGPWAVFAVTGPHWLGSRFNVSIMNYDGMERPGNRFHTLQAALVSFKEHTQPKPRLHSYLSTGYNNLN